MAQQVNDILGDCSAPKKIRSNDENTMATASCSFTNSPSSPILPYEKTTSLEVPTVHAQCPDFECSLNSSGDRIDFSDEDEQISFSDVYTSSESEEEIETKTQL